MPKWVQNVLFGIGMPLAVWRYVVGDMIWAGVLTFALGFATAISGFTKTASETEKLE